MPDLDLRSEFAAGETLLPQETSIRQPSIVSMSISFPTMTATLEIATTEQS